jgi:hypothetical protein
MGKCKCFLRNTSGYICMGASALKLLSCDRLMVSSLSDPCQEARGLNRFYCFESGAVGRGLVIRLSSLGWKSNCSKFLLSLSYNGYLP